MTQLAKSERSALVECETIIKRGRDTFIEVGNALLRIREDRLYRAEFGTFQEYCEAKWSMSRIHAHRMIDAAEVASNLLPTGNIPPTERATRPLVKLPPAVQREAWREAVAASPNGKPTAKEVEAAVEIVAPAPRAERINYKPSNGLQYAAMAIANLEKIQPNDTEREGALNKVACWIKRNR
jgi:hypothetical protein